MSASIALQKDVCVSYLGSPGAFSHQAAYERFGDSVAYVSQKQIDGNWCHSFIMILWFIIKLFLAVFEAVEKGQTTYGIVPYENSTFGVVVETLDYFIRTSVKVRAETYLPIHHCLLSNSKLEKITKVYSHPQGFGQTQKWLSEHIPNAVRIAVKSTSEAAEKATLETGTAAVCSEICAKLYGLEIVAANIEDSTGKAKCQYEMNDYSFN